MKKGFTLVELLASLAIMSLIIVISVPAYNGISSKVKENNLNSKKSMMEKATLAFINKYKKDEVFDGSSHTICFTIHYLINKGIFEADTTDGNMTDPVKGGTLNGYLQATYDTSKYEVNVKYVESGSCDKTY